jgi:hypothetical protein
MAAGLVWLAGVLASSLGPRLRAMRPGLSASVAGVAGMGIALGLGHQHDADFYRLATSSVGMVSASDLAVMRQSAAQLPHGTSVMADGIDDAGQWVTALTPDVLFLSKDFVIAHPHDPRLAAIANACQDPEAARQALDGGVGAVFIGSRRRAGAEHPWSVDCVARIPGLRLIAEAGSGTDRSAAFVVQSSLQVRSGG